MCTSALDDYYYLLISISSLQNLNDALESGADVEKQYVRVHKNVYTEFSEFSRKEIKEYEKKFKR